MKRGVEQDVVVFVLISNICFYTIGVYLVEYKNNFLVEYFYQVSVNLN